MQDPLTRFAPQLIGEYPRPFLDLFKRLNLTDVEEEEVIKKTLWKAYYFSNHYHEDQKRKSGRPYFDHCLAVAKILASWNMDHITVMGGLLHDTVEDTEVTLEEIEEKFGSDLARLVDGVTKLGDIKFSSRKEQQTGNIMKMLLSVARDLRVIIIKFADRLHNMQTIRHLSDVKQRRIAIETRDIYAPLAHRLGMAAVKWQLDDLVFSTLNPEMFKEIDVKLKTTYKERTRYIREFSRPIKDELSKHDIKVKIYGRPKSHASIYKKMINRGKEFEEIFDIIAIRVVVDTTDQCYLAMGIVHQLFTPIPERFKDFVASPKLNAYQSIHTTVVGPRGRKVEIQIRTHSMEQTAEIGVAAHWRYKEGGNYQTEIDSHMKWLRELVDILQSESADPSEFMHLLKIDLFNDIIFVLTPAGDLIQLPAKATPVDFAFQVHTEIGLHCMGAKVNRNIAPLNSVLKNGDTVEIITSQNQSPHYGWLRFAITSKARNNINRYLRKLRYAESVKLGNEILEKTLRRLKRLDLSKKIQEAFGILGYKTRNDLIAAIGDGSLMIRDILKKLFPAEETKVIIEDDKFSDDESFLRLARGSARGVKLQGISNILVSFGRCCNPIPGDDIVGFVTRGRGITLHRADCASLPLLDDDSDRIIPVEWDVKKNDTYSVRIKVVSQDRSGILREISEAISAEEINISSVDLRTKDNIVTAFFVVQVRDIKQLERVKKRITRITGIDYIERTVRE
ncbi:MAG: bifunctional (p)ppGpp synthetase/guanosine-3',5'-bis(diphosphate) 3'-pyrophosphohydrolase [Candidatus Marinimicrobia bacterium]|nr:bifunctional (p)ppGpp synthetase/guanosine-3',5'-bis(diphosphate) 3'-pyrophosphohydrolase [Candidatus Neomarinimicrobiota bacterium]